MLVLALEFSRGCTAHAGAGTPSPPPANKRKLIAAGQTARPGHARGERSPPAREDLSTNFFFFFFFF